MSATHGCSCYWNILTLKTLIIGRQILDWDNYVCVFRFVRWELQEGVWIITQIVWGGGSGCEGTLIVFVSCITIAAAVTNVHFVSLLPHVAWSPVVALPASSCNPPGGDTPRFKKENDCDYLSAAGPSARFGLLNGTELQTSFRRTSVRQNQ